MIKILSFQRFFLSLHLNTAKGIWIIKEVALQFPLPQAVVTERCDFRGLNISVGYYSNVQKLAGGKNKNSDNGNAYLYSGRFPVSIFRFPASTLNVGQRERPRFMSVLVGTFVYWLDAL